MTTTPQEPGDNPDVPDGGDGDPDLTPGGDPEANPHDPQPGNTPTEDPS